VDFSECTLDKSNSAAVWCRIFGVCCARKYIFKIGQFLTRVIPRRERHCFGDTTLHVYMCDYIYGLYTSMSANM